MVSVEAELVVPCSRCGGTLLIEMPQLEVRVYGHRLEGSPVAVGCSRPERTASGKAWALRRRCATDATRVPSQASQRVEVDFASAGTAFLGASLEFNASKVDIWWPAGLGQQPLYHLKGGACSVTGRQCRLPAALDYGLPPLPPGGRKGVCRPLARLLLLHHARDARCDLHPPPLIAPDEPAATFIPGDGQDGTSCDGCSSMERRLGFRTLQLVREPLQQAAAHLLSAGGGGRGRGGGGGGGGDEGESFFFAVNGVPLFVKARRALVRR